jgi:hypothetical protein
MSEIIRRIFWVDGKALFTVDNTRYLNDEIMDLFDSIDLNTIEMDHISKDKENMHKDVQNLKSDFRKAVKSYHIEKSLDG